MLPRCASQASPEMHGPGHASARRSTAQSFALQLRSLPPALRPLVRAYVLGYASAVVPRLLTLVLQNLSRARPKNANRLPADQDERTFAESVLHTLRTGLEPQRFPTFCALLVGGSTLLQVRSRCPATPLPHPPPRPHLISLGLLPPLPRICRALRVNFTGPSPRQPCVESRSCPDASRSPASRGNSNPSSTPLAQTHPEPPSHLAADWRVLLPQVPLKSIAARVGTGLGETARLRYVDLGDALTVCIPPCPG